MPAAPGSAYSHRLYAQAIIGNYAVPILEERQVWGTTDETRTAYLDSQASVLAPWLLFRFLGFIVQTQNQISRALRVGSIKCWELPGLSGQPPMQPGKAVGCQG